MNCKAVQTRLSAYLDRELSASDSQAVRAHLHDCEGCAREAQDLRSLKSFLCSAPVPEPSADLKDRLHAAIRAEQGRLPTTVAPKGKTLPAGWASRLSFVSFVGIAACSMAVTFMALSTLRQPNQKPVASPKAPSQDVAFDVKWDQVYTAGLDATSGMPLVSAAGNVRH